MFWPIYLFELKYRLRRPATWIYFGLLTLMSCLLILTAGGAFGESARISLGGDGQTVKINAPASILTILWILSTFAIIIASSLMGNPVYRDFEHKTHSLFFTTPITKLGYLGGRFFGALTIAVLVFSGLGLGAALASIFPTVVADRFLPSAPAGTYLWPYVVIILPNLLFTGAIFFTMATLTRNILSTYIGAVLLLVAYLATSSFIQELKNEHLVAALDAFGYGALEFTTRYWTPAEKNSQLVPLSSYILLNRAVWLGVGIALLAFCYVRFRFSAFVSDKAPSKKKARALAAAEVPQTATGVSLVLPRVRQTFSFMAGLRQWWSLTRLEFRGVVRSVYFLAIAGAGVILLLANGSQVGKMFGTSTYPVTYEVVGVLGGTFFLFLLAIIIYYSGELVWREREAQVAQIVDATPVPTWVPFLSKLAALGLVQVVLLTIILVCGVLLQTIKGYTHYELGLYVKELYGLQLPYLLLWCVLAMLIQVAVNNKYLGHFVVVVFYIANIFRSDLGLTHRLFGYAGSPGVTYSDMNGFGPFLEQFWWLKLYWAGIAVLLVVVSILLWVRGTDSKGRFKEASRRFSLGTVAGMVVGLCIAGGAGGFVFYNTNILNKYTTPKEQDRMQAEYERKYRKYLHVPQPRITASRVDVDIYPKTRQARLVGELTLVNRHAFPVDSIIVNWQGENTRKVSKLELVAPGATVAVNDTFFGFRIYKLAQPLASGDSLPLRFDLNYGDVGFSNGTPSTEIADNGTFFNSSYVPGLGYQEDAELSEDKERKEQGLVPKPRMAPVNDLQARQNTYISHDADWIRFETTVSTDADQIAIAPGYLQKEWVQGDRRYFSYKMDRPMLNFYSWLSARYKKYTEQWVDTLGNRTLPIEIYYTPGHEYNLKSMAQGAREALSYCTKNFSPYQHRQVRILEFPRYASFAQSFANTIPFSESIGFIARIDTSDADDINYPLYITAHEVAHQWWAHQVIGGNVQGSTLMSESMAEYSALMVMKHHFGPYTMGKFLKYDLDDYLGGRSMERKKEVPLALVEDQPYIHYNKGSVIMYALQDYLGEEKLNAALKTYVQRVAYQGPPYTNSTEFIQNLRLAAPDSLQSLITDYFEKITLYDNRVTDAKATKLPDGRYRVTMTVTSAKFYSDSLGNETAAPLNDWLPVAVFPEERKDGKPTAPLALTRFRFRKGDNKIEFTVSGKPGVAKVDPYTFIIDRKLDDNEKEIKL